MDKDEKKTLKYDLKGISQRFSISQEEDEEDVYTLSLFNPQQLYSDKLDNILDTYNLEEKHEIDLSIFCKYKPLQEKFLAFYLTKAKKIKKSGITHLRDFETKNKVKIQVKAFKTNFKAFV